MTNDEIIKEIVERLKKVPEVKKIIVFGSRARVITMRRATSTFWSSAILKEKLFGEDIIFC